MYYRMARMESQRETCMRRPSAISHVERSDAGVRSRANRGGVRLYAGAAAAGAARSRASSVVTIFFFISAEYLKRGTSLL